MPTKIKPQILFVTSFPSRECGIATYSNDLLTYLNQQFSNTFSYAVCALEDGACYHSYNTHVRYRWNIRNESSYLNLAQSINRDPAISLVFIQHEFGLFGGHWGNELVKLLQKINKPVVTTFHTVLPSPINEVCELVQEITTYSDAITVMTKKSSDILTTTYGIDKGKISVIPHGTHSALRPGKKILKSQYGLEDCLILSTFGLIGPNKSIETALEAMPSIVEHYPNVKYLILGKTHPGVVKSEGEKYRTFLEEKCRQLNITNSVIFINKYLTLNELLDYLNLTDIYLFTSKDPYQAVSGTFSYARSCGCPIVATRIPHAEEFLKDGSGVLVDFENPSQMSRAVLDLLSNPSARVEMGKRGFENSLESSWENVSIIHVGLFKKALNIKVKLQFNPPALNYTHLKRLQTKTGVLRLAELAEPMEESGYSLYENSLATIIYLYHNRLFEQQKFTDAYLEKSIAFFERCQLPNGSFAEILKSSKLSGLIVNKDSFFRANGTAIWAMGELMAYTSLKHTLRRRLENLIKKHIEWIENQEITRTSAAFVKGLSTLYHVNQNPSIKYLINRISTQLLQTIYSIKFYSKKASDLENEIGISEAFLYAYKATNNIDYKNKALEMFKGWSTNLFYANDRSDIIEKKVQKTINQTFKYSLIYPEDPVLVAQIIGGLNVFYQTFYNANDFDKMMVSFNWYLGDNMLKRIMYNPSTGGCYAKINQKGIDINQNAAPTLSFLLSRLLVEKAWRQRENSINNISPSTKEIG